MGLLNCTYGINWTGWIIPFRLILALALPGLFLQIASADDTSSEIKVQENALELSTRQSQQLASFNRQIASLESELGPFDPALLEPLQGLTGLLLEAGDLEEAGRVINRRLQLIRVEDGPTSTAQLPILKELISNNIRLRQWQEVTENFTNLHYIQSQNSAVDALSQLNAKNDIRAWHHMAIYLDDPSRRIRHFQESRRLQREQLREAEEIFGEESPELIPWLYHEAIEQHRVVAFITSRDELGADAKDHIIAAEHKSRVNYLRQGLHIVKRIRRIVETMGNPEAEYYLSMDAALEAQLSYGYQVTPSQNDEEAVIHMGDYVAWNESLPAARRPLFADSASSLTTPLNSVDVSFNISSRGEVRTPNALLSDPDSVSVRRDAKDGIERMQFRPRFEGRRWRRSQDVTMRYFYPPPL